MKRPDELMDQDRVIELVKKADTMLEERAVSSSPSRKDVPNAEGVPKEAQEDTSETERPTAPHPMNDAITRVSAMPTPPEARPPEKPKVPSRTALGKKRPWDYQADVETRVIPMSTVNQFRAKPNVDAVQPVNQSSKTPVPAPAVPPPVQAPMLGTTTPPQTTVEQTDNSFTPKEKRPSLTDFLMRGKKKWIIGGVSGVILALTVIFSIDTSNPPPKSSPTPKNPHTTALTPQPAEIKKEEAKDVSAAESETPAPNTVLIYLEGAPEESRVKVNGVVSTRPLRLPKSSEIVTVVVKAKGYKRWRRRIVPNRERHLTVRMKRKKKKPSP